MPCLVNSSLEKKKVISACSGRRKITHFAFPNLASWNSYDHRCPDEPMVLATEWENDADPVPFVSNMVRKRGELPFDYGLYLLK